MRHQETHADQLSRRVLPTGRFVTMLIAAGCFGILVGAVAANGDLSALIGAAREKFTPIGDDQLAAAKAELTARAADMKRFVRPQSANGRKWLDYLRWETVEAQLASEGPLDPRPLLATLGQLNRDENGLEMPPFRRLADALQHYLVALTIARQENQADAYARQLEGLANELQRYGESPNPDVGAAIGLRLDLVDGLGQAPELVAAVREQFARPNAFVTVSTKLLRDAAADPIDRDDPVTDCILGVSIHGQGHTKGSVALRTVPSDDKAVVELATDGRVVSQNVGRKGPAVIRSTGFTDFDAIQVVELSDASFRSHRAKVSATTTSDLHSVSKSGGGFGARFVSKVGMKKAREKQGQANRIAGNHAEDRIARRMGDEVDDRLRDAWDRYQKEYRLPLVRRGQLPEHIRFSTTDDALAFEVVQASRGQLAAPGEPPLLPADQDLVARVHETAVNNYTAAMLGGATISESAPGEGTKADVRLPKWIKDAWENRMDEKAEDAADADFEPWSLTFRRDRPITVAFADGKLALTLHIAHLTSGDDEFDHWDVTGTFAPELADGTVTLHREGELVVFPTGFDREGGQLSSREVAVRRNLTKVLTERSDEGRGFPQTINIEPLEPSDDFADVGPLPVQEFASGEGWLTVAWNRE